MTVGLFVGSLLLNKKKALAILIPAAVSAITTLIMYIGEMILLHGHLYRFGTGFFFNGIPAIVLAPVDILVILAAGIATFLLMQLVVNSKPET